MCNFTSSEYEPQLDSEIMLNISIILMKNKTIALDNLTYQI